MQLEILNSGIIYKNMSPGFKSESAYLPNLVSLSEKEILCFIRIGSAFYSPDGKICQFRSIDAGNTWIQENPIELNQSDENYHYTAPHCTTTSNGELILLVNRKQASNDETYQMDNNITQHIIFTSRDKGKTWTGYETYIPQSNPYLDTPSNIIELDNGQWFLGCEEWININTDRTLYIKGFGIFSDDRGKSWNHKIDFPSSHDKTKMYSHSRYTKSLDGKIRVLQWTQTIGGQEDFDAHIAMSDINGENWTAPEPTGIPAQTSWLADMGHGNFVAVYTHRTGFNPGIKAVVSTDFGKSWNNTDPIILWDSVGQEFLGVQTIPEYPKSHDNIAFGKPNLIRINKNELIASWWCTQACVTHARYARLKLK